MTEGTSQGLFIVVAIVIFGIFVGLSYNLFGKTLQPALVNLFETALNVDVGGSGEGPITPPPVVEEEVVVFEDENLEKAVRETLRLNSTEPITNLNIEKLTNLSALGKGIKSLKGLEYAVNLNYLNIYSNEVTDIKPIKDLTKLTNLRISRNSIKDISAVENLTNLTFLEISMNNLTNVQSVKNLTKLKIMYASGNKIVDLSPLSGLIELTELNLLDNEIRNVKPLENLKNLKDLNLTFNRITDFTPVEFVPKLSK